MEIYAIKLNGFSNPIGCLCDQAVLSWKVRGAQGKRQSNVAIQMADIQDFSHILWEASGAELNSCGVKLDLPLVPRTRYYCRIMVTSDAGETASGTCFFETGKLREPWTARWIGMEADRTVHPEFQKQFTLSGSITSARLYICGLGVFEAYLGDQKIGEDYLAPFINDYQEHIQYCTYDVTSLLKDENTLAVSLGNGWYRGRFGLSGKAHYERPFALIAELHVTYADSKTEIICTDETWQVRRGITTRSDIYDGETQDYLRGWGEWAGAVPVAAPASLVERYSPPLHGMESLAVKEVVHTPSGEIVLDFGQNFTGYVECTQPIPKGEHLTLEFGEILQNGNFYHDNYRTARSDFTYISDGNRRTIRPRFTFFGFRYVKVSGIREVDPAAFTGRVVYSEMDRTGYFETGSKKINRLHENTLWGLKSNFLDMPTDCPQRDERLGWCGDANVFSTTAGYLMDTRAFYGKFLRDLRSDQKRNAGKVAIYLPNDMPGICAAVWSDVAAFLPHMLYEYYGDLCQLQRDYPLMRDWVDSIRHADQARGEKFLWDFGFQFGDWLALDGATEQSMLGGTDSFLIASIYYCASAGYVAKAAEQLGYTAEAADYAALAGRIRTAILDEYFTPAGRLAVDTQTGYLSALKFGIYRDKRHLADGLKNRIKKDCFRIKGGFVGATMMNTVLAENGLSDMAYDFLFFEGFPGWLYAVNLGATTIWERWNSVLPDGRISGTGMNSLNHYAYGSVMEFAYRHAAGIAALAPGFRRARLAPLPDARLGWSRCSFDSASGRYVSNWTIEKDGSLTFHVEVPFGCTAELCLPEQSPAELTAGSYDFHIQTKRDYRVVFNADKPVEQLLAHPGAQKVLEEYIPGFVDSLKGADIEGLSKSLNDLKKQAALFGGPIDAYDRAADELQKVFAEEFA